MVGLGFTCFFTGLIGWVGGVVESTLIWRIFKMFVCMMISQKKTFLIVLIGRCLVLLFLISVVLSMFVELGGIVYLKFVQTEVSHNFS